MSVEKDAQQNGRRKIVYLIFAIVCVTLFVRLGLLGILTPWSFPYNSPIIFLILLLAALVLRIVSSPFIKRISIAKIVSIVTAIEWICWTLIVTNPLLIPYTYVSLSIKLPITYTLYLLDHLLILLLALGISLIAIISIRKGKSFIYVLSFYTSIILTLVSTMDAVVPKTKTLPGEKERLADVICEIKEAEPILSYKCFEQHQPWCSFLFDRSSPYNIVYHNVTNQLIISGGNSGLLVFMNMNNGEINRILKFDGVVKYLTYDGYRDKILVDVRGQDCLSEIDPYTLQQTNCYFKNVPIKAPFQLGCFNQKWNILTYNVDTKTLLYTRDYNTGEERVYSIFPLSCPYGIVCTGDEVLISSACPSPLLNGGIMIVKTQPKFKILQKERVIFPAMDMRYDPRTDLVYVARPAQGRVDVYQRGKLKKLLSIKAISGARELALDAKRDYIYAGSFGSGEIVKIDLKSRQIVKSFNAGPLLRDLVYIDSLDAVFAVSACGVYKLRD